MPNLTLPEGLLLLSLHDERGVQQASFVEFALAGAAISDLILRGIIIRSPEKQGRFAWGEDRPTGDPFLDQCRTVIREYGIGKDPQSLIRTLGSKRNISAPLINRLVERGFLRVQKKKFLFFFTQTTHPEVDPTAEAELKQTLAQVMFHEQNPSPEHTVLIALAKTLDILRKNFDKTLLTEHKERIETIVRGDALVGTATKATIEAINTAIAITIIMPAVILPIITS